MAKAVLDTSVLLQYPKILMENEYEFVIHVTVLEEIDGIINGDFDENKKAKAREARRYIKESGVKLSADRICYVIPLGWKDNVDNGLIRYAKDLGCSLCTNDLTMQLLAKTIGVECFEYWNGDAENETQYTGFLEINGSANDIIDFFQDIEDGNNKYNLLENQYVVINQEGKNPSEYRYNAGKLKRLKLPEINGLRPLNSEQRCAFDLLLNENIPIKVIAGSPGSGKTLIATRLGLHLVKSEGKYGKLLMLRNPIGSGEEIGFLSGSKEEKCGAFYKPIQQHMESMDLVGKGKNREFDSEPDNQIEQDIPYYIKGMSYGSTFVLFDEAEDADLKLLRLVGSRIEKDSCVVFTGDFKQAESKFVKKNGLTQLIKQLKGNPLVGIVVLSEDVRSPASKVFADLY